MSVFALTAVAAVLAAGHVKVGVTPPELMAGLRVVDAKTGETIEQVLEADVAAGKVTRYAVQDGNFVFDGNTFRIIDEDREIRIEAIEPPAAEVAGEGEPEEHTA